jgi:hypothetical protein
MRKLWLVLLLVAACGGDGSSAATTLDELGPQLSQAECTKAFRCCTQDQLSALFQSAMTLTTTAQCEQYVDTLLSGIAIPKYMASVTAGRLQYDADAAGACVNAIGGQSCTDFDMTRSPSTPGGCATFLKPLVAIGGACSQTYECINGYCKGAVTMPTPMDGTCTALPAMGQPCTALCATGLYCDQSTGSCQMLKADGTTCTVGIECRSGACPTGQCGPVCG